MSTARLSIAITGPCLLKTTQISLQKRPDFFRRLRQLLLAHLNFMTKIHVGHRIKRYQVDVGVGYFQPYYRHPDSLAGESLSQWQKLPF